jgi:dTDP-4-amino-4,6-dideoxygalactose transaminase
VLVEPELGTFNIDPLRIEEKITDRTRAIMVVHLYGRSGMHDRIQEIARKYGLKVVEDNAQAAGCFFAGRRTGSLGAAAAHSFFPTKNLGALGDGGAVTTDDADLAEMVRTLGNYGSRAKGINDVAGVNSRLDELQAAVLCVKLAHLDRDNNRRREIATYYLNRISNPLITLPQMPAGIKEHVWHLFVVRCGAREALQGYLRDRGIETLVHYAIPPHQQRACAEMNHLQFPVTEQIHREVLSLPLHPALEEDEFHAIAEAVNGFRS